MTARSTGAGFGATTPAVDAAEVAAAAAGLSAVAVGLVVDALEASAAAAGTGGVQSLQAPYFAAAADSVIAILLARSEVHVPVWYFAPVFVT